MTTFHIPLPYLEAAWGIPALSSTADQVIQLTFINIRTNFPCTINLIPWITYTPV